MFVGMKEIGIANLPNLRHKTHAESGIRFNLLVAGSHGLGKTTFLNNFLGQVVFKEHFTTTVLKEECRINVVNLEIEEENLQVKMDIVEIDGIGDNLHSENVAESIESCLLERFHSYTAQFENVVKSEIDDNRIHLCLYFIEPVPHIKESDTMAINGISKYCTVVPVVGKADLLTDEDMNEMRRVIANNMKDYEPYFMCCTTDCSPMKEYNWGVVRVDAFDFHRLRSDVLERMTMAFYSETEYLYDRYRISQIAGEVLKGDELAERLNNKQKELDEIKERIRHKRELLDS